MTTQITAVFDDRDGADLALMRLRRNGIEFSIAEMKDMPLLGISPGYGTASPAESVLPGQMYAAVLGSRAAMERSASAAGRARLAVNVRTDQVLRAREIIASAKGRIL